MVAGLQFIASGAATNLVPVFTNRTATPVRSSRPDVAPLTNAVQPTVTAEMGDVGGKFFGQAPDANLMRRYYIAAEPQLWDYAPSGADVICGKPLPPPVLSKRRGGKLRYVQYTDASFTAKAFEDSRLGLLGPALRANAGQFIAITFLNRSSRPLSMHPHGLKYDKDSEGSFYQPKPGLGAAVGPGATFTYVWHADTESGPLPEEPSSKGWLYHSHVQGDEESDLGLVGFIVVTDPKRARANGTPNDVDRELAALFMIHDESGMGAAIKEAAEYGGTVAGMPALSWAQVQELMEQGARHAINGYIFGNTPGLEMNEGERVRWYLFGLGSEEDFHTAHWHGLRVAEEGRRRTDVVELLPATMKVADMTADNPGSWLFHCHVAEHMMEGMFARVIVHAKSSAGVSRAAERAFFGLPQAQQSLRVSRAQAIISGGRAEIQIAGAVTVHQAFSAFVPMFQLQLGDAAAQFQLTRQGTATNTNGTFRVKNANPYGVVYGGSLEFEAVLSGPQWADELVRLGAGPGGGDLQAPVSLQVGKARHSTRAMLEVRPGNR
jgi:manganese oxidase